MAKISKKPPSGEWGPDVKGITDRIASGIEDALNLFGGEPITHVPNVDMFSTPDELIVEVEMPGVRKADIDVVFYKNALTIKAMKYDCFEDNKINYVCMERLFGRLFRSIEIPFPVDSARIKAAYVNGILTLTIPRVEDKRNNSKKVKVESL